MDYVLYGAPGSGASIVEAALCEAGLTYEYRRLDMKHAAQRAPDYAAVNPHRKVPTLVTPDGETLTEAAAIVSTLAARHPQADLLPPLDAPQGAQALRWMQFAAAELYPLVEILDYPERFAPDAATAPAVKARAEALWHARWAIVEGSVDDEGPYLLGARYTAVDAYLTALSGWVEPDTWRVEHLPRIERLAHAVASRPLQRAVWQRNAPRRFAALGGAPG